MSVTAAVDVVSAAIDVESGVGSDGAIAHSDFVTGLRCRECGAETPADARYACEQCFGPLEVAYDRAAIAATITRARIEAGPSSIWRYRDLLPAGPSDLADLAPGLTPLIRADRLAAAIGLDELWIKDDTRNPTNSFKDRVVACAVARAVALGFDTIACASTGNLANAVAAAAARAGLDWYVFIPSDLEAGKVVTTASFIGGRGSTSGSSESGPAGHVIAIDGTYDDVNRLCAQLADEKGWAFVNVNLRPYYAEGSKTLAFETAEQLGWELPDHIVAPMASGSLLTKVHKGFGELIDYGLVTGDRPRVSGAQASGCAPIAHAYAADEDLIRPVRTPNTIAKSLAIGNPADGIFALDVIRETKGGCAAVSDEEIVDAMRLLASTTGIFGETAAGVTIAGLRRLVSDGVIRPDERVVAYVTGHGLKTLDALVEVARPTATIRPTLDAFEHAFGGTR